MVAEQNGATPDVTILGAGIVGITTALSLTERGFKVALIDRSPPAEGASYGNAGSLSPWSCVPQSMPGLWKSIPGWLVDPEGPVALRLAYTTKFLPWAVKFFQAGQEHRLPAIADAMMALTPADRDLIQIPLAGDRLRRARSRLRLRARLPQCCRRRSIEAWLAYAR